MAVAPTHRYEITWSNQGDRKGEPPMIVDACDVQLKDGHHTFYAWGLDGMVFPTMTVRAIDVHMVRAVD